MIKNAKDALVMLSFARFNWSIVFQFVAGFCGYKHLRAVISSLLLIIVSVASAQQNYLGISGGAHLNGVWVEHTLRGQDYETIFVQLPIVGFHSGVQFKHYNEIKSYRKLHSKFHTNN